MCKTVYSSIVTKIHDRHGKRLRTLVVTDVVISFYRVRKHPSRDRTMYWPFLTHIGLSRDCIDLEFSSEHIHCISSDYPSIMSKILKTIRRMLSPDEFLNLGFAFNVENKLRPNGRGVVARFKGCCLKAGITKMEPVLGCC